MSTEPTLLIYVNGTAEHTSARTLQDWAQQQPLAPEAFATAVNGTFVPRGLRAQQVLQAGDAIMTFQPITGG